jgi:hypothetical protein
LSAAVAKGEPSAQLKSMAAALEKDSGKAKNPADADRMKALAAILKK